MNDTKMDRRVLLKTSLAAFAGRALVGGGTAGILGLWPTEAYAKPGGHRAVQSECRATFEIDHAGLNREVTLYLSGGGYASFDNAYDYQHFDVQKVLRAQTVSMEWETDCKFAGNYPEWGVIECRGLVRGKSNTRSGITLISNSETGLFPATMINTLFCEMFFPAFGLRAYNKEPIVLRGVTHNMTPEDIEADVRVRRAPEGLPENLRRVVKERRQSDFNPLGTHTLQEKGVEFYNRADPDQRVATLIESNVTTLPHYGIDIRLVSSKLSSRVATVTWEIQNLLAKRDGSGETEIIWYVDDSHELEIISDKQGLIKLGKEPFRVEVTAISRHPTKRLLRDSPSAPLVDKACLFCGAQNLPKTLDTADLISGFAYTDIFELRARA